MEEDFRVEVAQGKYTIIYYKDGKMEALRCGEKWRDLVGDNLIYNLAWELNDARDKIEILGKIMKLAEERIKELSE